MLQWPSSKPSITLHFDASKGGVAVVEPEGSFCYAPVLCVGMLHINFLEYFAAILALEFAIRLGHRVISLVGDSVSALAWIRKKNSTDDAIAPWIRQFLFRWQECYNPPFMGSFCR